MALRAAFAVSGSAERPQKNAILSRRVKGVQARTPTPRAKLRARRAKLRTPRTMLTAPRAAKAPGRWYGDSYVHILPRPSVVFSTAWQSRFAKLSGQYDRLSEEYLTDVEPPALHEQTAEWVQRLSLKMDSGDTIDLGDEEAGREVWLNCALWFLYHQRDLAIGFLVTTHTPSYPPINWVEDCLQYLARHMAHLEDPEQQKQMASRLAHAFVVLADRENGEHLHLQAAFTRHLIPHCSDEQIVEHYEIIKTKKVKVPPHAWQHLVDYFARNQRVEQAWDALLESRKVERGMSELNFLRSCSTVLRASVSHPAGLRLTLSIIENLVGMGLKLNRQLCNVVMINAVEAGDFDTAMSVHHSAIEQVLEPDAYTCAILLKMCKSSVDDGDLLRDIVQLAIRSGDVRRNRIVANEVLHCLALHHVKHNPQTAFKTVFEAYAQLFTPAPLRDLGIKIPDDADSGQALMDPDSHTLGYMIATYLDYGTDAQEAHRLYTRWRELVETGAQLFASSAAKPHVATIFLQRFTRLKKTLLHAAQVIKDMQRPLPASAGVTQALPDVVTWSVFLDGFVKNGQVKLAEQILNYMRSKGIEPDDVSWNSLISGYAGAQDLEGTLHALKGYDQTGKAFDKFTYAGLRKFRNRERLRDELEKTQLQRRLDFTDDLRHGLEQRVEGLDSDLFANLHPARPDQRLGAGQSAETPQADQAHRSLARVMMGSLGPEQRRREDHGASTGEDGFFDSPAEAAEEGR